MAKKFYKESELVFEENAKSPRFQDLTGQKFKRLTVLGFAGRNTVSQWFCRCECGNITKVLGNGLKNGDTSSCGCLQKEQLTTHGYSLRNGKESRTYITWQSMIARCKNPSNASFMDYGSRGIEVCSRWLKFENFLADMGERPKGKTLDRKENEKGYYKENCRWATPKEQANNRSTNVMLTHNGKTLNVAQWAEELGLKRTTVYARLKLGWSIERALTT